MEGGSSEPNYFKEGGGVQKEMVGVDLTLYFYIKNKSKSRNNIRREGAPVNTNPAMPSFGMTPCIKYCRVPGKRGLQ